MIKCRRACAPPIHPPPTGAAPRGINWRLSTSPASTRASISPTWLLTYTGGSLYGYFGDTFGWASSSGHYVTIEGSGFSFPGLVPAGGPATSFKVDLGNNAQVDLMISGLSFDLSQLAGLAGGLTAAQENDLIWRTVLAGSDSINFGTNAAGNAFSILFAGDGNTVEANQYQLGGTTPSRVTSGLTAPP